MPIVPENILSPSSGGTPLTSNGQGRRVMSPGKKLLFTRRSEIGAVTALIATLVIFSILNPSFTTFGNLGGVLTVAAELGFMALGVGVLMISAEIDISIAGVFTFGAIVMGELLTHGWNPVLALVVVLAYGVAAGAINAFFTLKAGIPSLITTLGTLGLWTGLSLAVSGGDPVNLFDHDRVLDTLAGSTVAGDTLHVSVLWWLGIAIVLYFVLERSGYGNWVYATGGNGVAARRVGVPINRVKLINFILASTLATLAGVTSLGRNSSISPVVTSNNLDAIAAAVIGGVSIWGGLGTVLGMVVGTLTIGAINVGLVAAGAPAFWYEALVGTVIVVIVVVNRYIDTSIARWVKP